jgi:hypothetical protein
MDVVFGTQRHRPTDSPFRSALNLVLTALVVALSLVASSAAQGAVINATSPSLTDVRRAIASAADGDTVMVPAGTASWTSNLTITKSITIQGQTTTNTDDGTANDRTILVDNLARVGGGRGYFHCTTNAGQSLRITGITFSGLNGSQSPMSNGAIRLGGSSDHVRIDHCHFAYLHHGPMIAVYGAIFGVSDHNIFDHFVDQNFSHSIWMANYGGHDHGDGAYAEDAGFGGPKFFFIEDNWISFDSWGGGAGGGVDAFFGGKYVFRHNRVWNATTLGHSTASSWVRGRGVRAQEIYNNEWHFNNPGTIDGTTGGSLIAHDNTFDGVAQRGFELQVYRQFWSYGPPFYGADGTQPWDVNDLHLYESGTLTSANNGVGTMIDTSKNWTTNQWVNYSVKRTSDNAMALIVGNASNTITYAGWQSMNWAAGNQYQIHKVLTILDQPGRGKGDLLSGNPPTPVGWPHQEREPCYSWNNVFTPTGARINFVRGSGDTIHQGRDYFNDTPMPGYTPYTYPHPLTRSQPPPEARASSLPQAQKEKKKWGGKEKRGWGKAKKTSANEMAQPEQ